MAKKDIAGQRFGRLVAIRPTEKRSGSNIVWECRSDCGTTTFVPATRLRRGDTKSCGCLRKEMDAERTIDLTGQRFGRLVAVRLAERRISAGVWECRCDCGSTTFVLATSLRSGATKSCGCLRKELDAERTIDLTGQRFGKLVVVRPTEERKNMSVVWECLCDCGETVFVSSHYLRSGTTKSCGCLQKESKAKLAIDLTGQRFGKLVAIRPTEKRTGGHVVWECHCDCGQTTMVAADNLRKGRTKSCGCARKELSEKGELTSMETKIIDDAYTTDFVMGLPNKNLRELFDCFKVVLDDADISQKEYQCFSAVIAEIRDRVEEGVYDLQRLR